MKKLLLEAAGLAKTQKGYFVVSMLALCILSLPAVFDSLPKRLVVDSGFSGTTSNQGTQINSDQSVCEAISPGGIVTLSLTGTLSGLFNYQGLFQTSDLNAGIRFEIDQDGNGGLLIGSKAADGYSGIALPGKFANGSFQLDITILDGKVVTVKSKDQEISKTISDLSPRCDDIVVGYGYSQDRYVRGTVNLSATVSHEIPRYAPHFLDSFVREDWFRTIISALFLFGFLVITFNISTRHDEDKHENTTE